MPANKDLIKIDEINRRHGRLLPKLMGLRFTKFARDRVLAALMVRCEPCTAGGILHGGGELK